MMKNTTPKEPTLELLLDYLDGILDYETQERIQKQLANSEELKAVFEGLRQYYEEVEGDREKIEAYKATLGIYSEEGTNKEETRTAYFFKIAASIGLLILAGAIFYSLQNNDPVNDFVNGQLSRPYNAPEVFRSDQSQVELLWTEASTLYKSGNYESAIEIIRSIDKIDGDDPTSQFYFALCQLYRDDPNYDEALKNLQMVAGTGHILSVRAKWFLALTYLFSGNADGARSFLEELKELDNYKGQEAGELLEMIK
ncbi:MAG: hypothetical protein RJQ09_12880 [Cyclobacteriaceae bacterium]